MQSGQSTGKYRAVSVESRNPIPPRSSAFERAAKILASTATPRPFRFERVVGILTDAIPFRFGTAANILTDTVPHSNGSRNSHHTAPSSASSSLAKHIPTPTIAVTRCNARLSLGTIVVVRFTTSAAVKQYIFSSNSGRRPSAYVHRKHDGT